MSKPPRERPLTEAPEDEMPCLGSRITSEDLVLDLNTEDPFAVNFTSPGYVFSLQLGVRDYAIALASDRLQSRVLEPGAITFSPKGTSVKARTGARNTEFLAFSVSDGLMARVLEGVDAELDAVRVEPNFVHPTTLPLALSLRQYVLEPSQSPLYAETLTTVFLHHLVSSWTRTRSARRGLPPWRVRRVQAFVEAQLGEKLGLDELAVVAGLSPYHFSRAFRAATGFTPHAYVMERRLQRSYERVAQSEVPLLEIALGFGFSSQAHLTTAFKRRFGTTPGALRRARLRTWLFVEDDLETAQADERQSNPMKKKR